MTLWESNHNTLVNSYYEKRVCKSRNLIIVPQLSRLKDLKPPIHFHKPPETDLEKVGSAVFAHYQSFSEKN